MGAEDNAPAAMQADERLTVAAHENSRHRARIRAIAASDAEFFVDDPRAGQGTGMATDTAFHARGFQNFHDNCFPFYFNILTKTTSSTNSF